MNNIGKLLEKIIMKDKAIQYSVGDKQFQGSYLPDFWPPATDSIDWKA